MASTKPTPSESKQEQSCPSCGKPMAADQRYCLNCGQRRADSRVEFRQHLFAGDSASENGVARAPAGRGWNPLAAAALIGLLGIALLVGVLIGKDENDEQTSTVAPAQTTPTTGATAAPATPPAATTPTAPATPPATTTPSTGTGAGGAAQPGGAAETEQGVPPASTKRGAR